MKSIASAEEISCRYKLLNNQKSICLEFCSFTSLLRWQVLWSRLLQHQQMILYSIFQNHYIVNLYMKF